jgi:hypothetical protein
MTRDLTRANKTLVQIELEKWLDLRNFLKNFTENAKKLKQLGSGISIQESLEMLLEATQVLRSLFHKNEMTAFPQENPEIIIKGTLDDGTVDSQVSRPKRVELSTNVFTKYMDFMSMIVITLKDGIILNDEMLADSVEKTIIDWFSGSSSLLKKKISEKIETSKERTPTERKFFPSNDKNEKKHISGRTRGSAHNTRAVTQLIRKYGLSVIPSEFRKDPDWKTKQKNRSRKSSNNAYKSKNTRKYKPKR